MKDINDRLRSAAQDGKSVELKALLQDPTCDALSKSHEEMTALMIAAYAGHDACVELLLPVSDALVGGKME